MTDDRRTGRAEVDARFVLANERTLLAWVRTALALLAGGGALVAVGDDIAGGRVLASLLVLVGIVTAVAGAHRFSVVDRLVRRGEVPLSGVAPYMLVLLVLVVGVGLLVAIALS